MSISGGYFKDVKADMKEEECVQQSWCGEEEWTGWDAAQFVQTKLPALKIARIRIIYWLGRRQQEFFAPHYLSSWWRS